MCLSYRRQNRWCQGAIGQGYGGINQPSLIKLAGDPLICAHNDVTSRVFSRERPKKRTFYTMQYKQLIAVDLLKHWPRTKLKRNDCMSSKYLGRRFKPPTILVKVSLSQPTTASPHFPNFMFNNAYPHGAYSRKITRQAGRDDMTLISPTHEFPRWTINRNLLEIRVQCTSLPAFQKRTSADTQFQPTDLPNQPLAKER